MLQQFGKEIWTAGGSTVTIAGFDYPTCMIIIRLSDGGLFIWSPIAFTSDLQVAVDRLGTVRHIVAPNTLHHLFMADWQRAYPQAKFHGMPRLRAKRRDLRWDSDLEDAPAAEWSEDIDQVIVRGTWIPEAVFFHRQSRTAIFTDLIQHFEPEWVRGWRALVARLDFLTASKPTVPRKFRVSFYDRSLARAALQRILAWPTEAVLAAHSPPITEDSREAIPHAFGWLLRR